MRTQPILLLYSPFPDLASARDAARVLLEAHLIACANMVEGGTSLYRSDQQVIETKEVLLLAKTNQAHRAQAIAKLGQLHPYETPAILTFEAEANAPYAQWLTAQLKTA